MSRLLILTCLLLILFTPGGFAQNKTKILNTGDFKHSDIGSPSVAGTVASTAGGFDITAGGADIWGVKDEFNFVYTELRGDFDIIAKVESFVAPHLYGKAGLMAREDLTPGSRHIYFQMFQDNKPRNKNNGGFEYQYRQAAGGEMKAIYPTKAEGDPEFPVNFPNTWIRLKRTGNNFTGFTGTDGKSWKEYATYTLDLPAKVFVGPAVTSHKATESATAKFRNLGLLY
jgi:hypothetical protein